MSQADASERYAMYKNPDIAHFLTELLKLGKEIQPKYDLTYGYRYPEVEEAVGKDPVETGELLRKLAGVGILKEKLFDMAIYCPSCNGVNISTKYNCPFCGSIQIVRNALIEHITCGYIDNVTNFRIDRNFICPRCKAQLGKEDYRNAGSWYECPACGKRIETPKVSHVCRGCGEKFTFDGSKYVEVYSYSVSEVAVDEIKGGAFFTSIAKSFFADLKYDIEVPGKILGESGIQNEFDVLLKKENGAIIAIDALLSNEPISQIQIIREYGKTFDVKAEVYIVASPSLSEDAKKLAKAYGLNIIEGDPSKALSTLKEMLLSKVPPKEKTEGKKKRSFLEMFFKRT